MFGRSGYDGAMKWRVCATAAAGAVAFGLILAAFGLMLAAAQPPVFRSGIELIDVAVVVRDREGRFVEGLTPADFQILEAGVPQTIAAFDRVSIPIPPRQAESRSTAATATDVGSNEFAADGRIFVLVLDAWHVSPLGVAVVRQHARRFVEEHVAPGDLAAVMSPGASAEATQDFTADKARLLAAIDRFSGTKLRSATLELEEERRAAALSGVLMHGGKDPSDSERADRARSLSSMLEALAGHLGRVERRRKALLLFSEGVDYNTADIMGGVQRHASDVMRAMQSAIASLMRTNVSLYAIDPRALATGDGGNIEAAPHVPAPNAPRADGSMPRLDFSEPSIAEEYAASVRTLRSIAESTGGFAAVTSNDVSAAFTRIVEESSDYYVIGYSSSKPPKRGEFRPLRVRVSRPGVKVIARSGYVLPAEPRRTTAPAPVRDVPGPFTAPGRPRAGRVDLGAAETPAAPRVGGVPSELAALLASPLPSAGLPLRVHAAPFKGNGKKASVQVVIEVLGSALGFAERSGKFETRIELASLTVDDRGRGANGRSTTIDLRLTAAELQRVRTTGVRWISRVDLSPGRYQVRVAGHAAATTASGLVTIDVEVPEFEGGAALSAVTLTSMPSVLMVTRGEARLAAALRTPPTAARTFVAGDRIVAAAEVYGAVSAREAVTLMAEVLAADGRVVQQRREEVARRPTAETSFTIDTASIAPGEYVIRLALAGTRASAQTERRVPFTVVANPARARSR